YCLGRHIRATAANRLILSRACCGAPQRDRVADIRACTAALDVIAMADAPEGVLGMDAGSDCGLDLFRQLFVCVLAGGRQVHLETRVAGDAVDRVAAVEIAEPPGVRGNVGLLQLHDAASRSMDGA